MIKDPTREDLERLFRLDLFDVDPTADCKLEAHVHDQTGRDRVPVEVWLSSFDPDRRSYPVRRIEEATIEMGWSIPRSLLESDSAEADVLIVPTEMHHSHGGTETKGPEAQKQAARRVCAANSVVGQERT